MASSEMASSSNPEPERDAEETNLNPNPVAPPVAPVVCLMRFASDSAAGGFMGSIFGYGELYPLLCSSCLTLLLIDGFSCANVSIIGLMYSFPLRFLNNVHQSQVEIRNATTSGWEASLWLGFQIPDAVIRRRFEISTEGRPSGCPTTKLTGWWQFRSCLRSPLSLVADHVFMCFIMVSLSCQESQEVQLNNYLSMICSSL